MVRRRSKLKQAEEDAMSRLTAVRWKFQEDELRVEELTIATNLLIEAADHRVLYQLLTLLLEWVRAWHCYTLHTAAQGTGLKRQLHCSDSGS